MGTGIPTSPVVFEQRDSDGNVIAAFRIVFSSPSPWPLTAIDAFNATGSPFSQIEVSNAGTNVRRTFPLPDHGAKSDYGTTDGSGTPTVVSMFTSSVSQAQIVAAGFTNLGDIGQFTLLP
jgi:hypothetical protein